MPRKRKARAIALCSNSEEWCLEECDPSDESQDVSPSKPVERKTKNQEGENQLELLQEKHLVSNRPEDRTK